jgi:serine-type D-Ala-D-Ala endopeptidase (penicillin-binding protein 7)
MIEWMQYLGVTSALSALARCESGFVWMRFLEARRSGQSDSSPMLKKRFSRKSQTPAAFFRTIFSFHQQFRKRTGQYAAAEFCLSSGPSIKEGEESSMGSRFALSVLVLLFTVFPLNLQAAWLPSARVPELRSAAVTVRDQRTGEFLLTKRAEIAMPIASITKLMTAMVVLDARLDMEEMITIEEQDKDMLRHSSSHLPVGTSLSRNQALLIALMASENRAAHALGRTYPGGVPALVRAMNEKARALSLTETRFVDPTGLSDANVSSAQDLSLLVDAASHYPQICFSSTQTEAFIQSGRKKLRFANTNALIRSRKWQIGLSKTGYIEEGGRCLVMQTSLAQRPVLIVLLNSSGKNTRLADANRIKQWIEGPDTSRKMRKQKTKKIRHIARA